MEAGNMADTPRSSSSSSSSVLVGAIVAGVVGGLAIGGLVLFDYLRKRKKPTFVRETAAGAAPTAVMVVDTDRGREVVVSEIEDVVVEIEDE